MKTTKPKTTKRRKVDPELIRQLFERFEQDKPEPKTELNYSNAFTLVTAVALSAQATDVSVNKATGPLFAIADNPADMLALGEDKLMQMISSIGLYRNKAKNVMAMCRILIDQYGGQVPMNREALVSLPGVGNKTASVVLNEMDIEPAIAVDTHVYRVSHRLGLVDTSANTPDKVEKQLMQVIPKHWLTRAHHWLILHGRYVCVARKPKCDICIVRDLCPKIGVDFTLLV
ncbi:endonuclease III [Asticcacaulis taihuensis]|uniref:Endonuclease III n=1 Tax=Asticcacaulis taihuensis TaxID=260084 RepID=A0A1G4TNT1_9CAUL|nr:endonuclease III [Asticcacaulis taihuensis]SCW82992.1 DNA-(apurinic or apyrimidinic site) lyase /endonuclease III [Asticcacaulis taihuensis]